MAKRIWGSIVLLAGLLLTVWRTVTIAYAIPANFTVEGKGLDAIVNLVTRYHLREPLLLVGLGVGMVLSAAVLLLSPRKVKVKGGLSAPITVPSDGQDLPVTETEPAVTAAPRLVRVYHTDLMGTAFANAGGRSRQLILSEIRAGDVVACRTVVKRSEDETETVGVFTVKGEQMGVIDLSVLRAIRDEYPNHRIGVTVEKISGGRGVPYTCAVRLGVYRG
ncbi:MAG: hypothetical protein J6K29_10710 [Clostridia bacterium]|nr:hypothetical protein [Clostridia bacterium]